ncbi:zinc-ribbon domain-containing protein [Azospirillum sp. TSO22-1]|uniref:zinc-ribbon domain-containing protein n=1 Tax=Azospirillum sp. TSO22-1 TaxID=716789 RepID=UPI000D647B9A|nr:zinc-ribbon domain-containing protein [Azospirillum sp. TSO22-1]
MLITCPNCSTRYTVADKAVPSQGRKVRCKSCGHVWYQRPVVEEPERTLLAEDLAPPRRPAAKPGKVKKPLSRGVVAGWAAFAVLLAAILAGGYFGRAHVVRLWPPAALLYETVGLAVDPPGTGLQLQNVRSEQRAENGATLLVVEGQILNASDVMRPVPKVRAVSLGFDRKPVQTWTIETTSDQLLPGEIATFRSTQRDPGAVAEVMVTFEGG